MRYRRLVALVVLTICTLPSTSRAAAIFTTIDVPGAPCTLPFAINNLGQIVGYYAETCTAVGPYPNGPVHGFLLDRGTFTTIDFPGATSTRAHGINNGGQIVGDYSCSTGCPGSGGLVRSFLLDRGIFTALTLPVNPDAGASEQEAERTASVWAYGINNHRQIVGDYSILLFGTFLLENGTFTTIRWGNLEAFGINDAGQIVGADVAHGYLRDHGTFTVIDFPRATSTSATGINNGGQIVGYYSRFEKQGGFLLNHGTFTTIDVPGAKYTFPRGINDGQVVGYYQMADGTIHGFVMDLDTSPPNVTANIQGTSGLNGWYKSSVNLTWRVSDPESSIASSSGCDPKTLTAGTTGVTMTCSATNGMGLSTSVPVTIKLDKTPPVISGLPAPGCTIWPPNGKLVQVATVSATDALSGLASVNVTATSNGPSSENEPSIVITGNGVQARTVQLTARRAIYTITATAADFAGNSVTNTATCTVEHQGK